jgi:hypothetical protein
MLVFEEFSDKQQYLLQLIVLLELLAQVVHKAKEIVCHMVGMVCSNS